MSAITIDTDLVHYEVLGRGRPVILIHGWLGSWRYWIPAMQQLSAKYRTYALDLWGFGDSGKDPKRFDFKSQVTLLDQFMEKMGITKAALVGHDLGAAIAAYYGLWHPDRVPRLLTICPPLFLMAPSSDSTLLPPAVPPAKPAPTAPDYTEADTILKPSDEMRARIQAALEARVRAIGDEANPAKSPMEAAQPPANQPVTDVVVTPIPAAPAAAGQIQQPNPLKEHLGDLDRSALLEKHVEAGNDLDKLKIEVLKADPTVLTINIDSFAGVDTLRMLRALKIPNVAVYGSSDTFVPPPTNEIIESLKQSSSQCHMIPMEGIRHFPMLENVAGFSRLLMDFLEMPDISKLEIKKQWERRVR